MIRKDIKSTKIFTELNKQEQDLYFSYSDKKYIHNVDTFYYSIFLKDDNKNINEFTENDLSIIEKNNSTVDTTVMKNLIKISNFVEHLNNTKTNAELKQGDIYYYQEDELLYKRRRFKIYDHCLSVNNMFDIFLSSYIPNENTPRIIVQLRSIGLWLDGVEQLILDSFNIVKKVLLQFEIEVDHVQENRIDYAYHTNIIQSPDKYFSDDILRNNLQTSFNIYSKTGRKNGNELTVEYLSLGSRRSNNLFFRTYNKTREVVEMNYKGFFIDLWFKNKLISFYDKFCLEFAYKKGSYSQLEFAKLEFYLLYGTDETIKEDIKLLKQDYSTNLEHIRAYTKNLLPAVTLVMNVEFQTMRKFYSYSDYMINSLDTFSSYDDDVLSRLFKILDNRKLFLNYLTSNTVYFIKNGRYFDWWERLRSLKIRSNHKCKELVRDYSRNLNMDKLEQRLKSTLASMNVYLNRDNTDLNQDYAAALCVLNDNDVVGNNIVFCDDETGEVIDLKDFNSEYYNMKNKKQKQLKSLLRIKED